MNYFEICDLISNGIRRYNVIECDSMIQKGLENTVKDYDVALDLELDSINKLLTQCLAFYQVTGNTIMDRIDFYVTETFGVGASNYEGDPL
ncbi:suppressor of RPS4-RLD 1-like [Vicia villosa]|uniref:suppressor of RPS4-RLD 1-like n=1 Tax=Vicia villosa TaxID=3911 RepID=UPI00273AC0F7|nr:suppressor of RPS4-RLD 1-like [Vicia villosa]